MGRKKDVSRDIKASIIAYLDSKRYSHREIARKTNVSQPTVSKIAKAINSQNTRSGLIINRRGNCGRKAKITERVKRKVVRMAIQNRRKPAKEIVKDLNDGGVDISLRSVERIFATKHLKCRRPAKKPKLTKHMIKQRLIWAKLHQAYTQNDWNKVRCQNIGS